MKILKKALSIIPILIFVIAVILIISATISIKNNKVPKVFGYSFMNVITGSMTGTIDQNEFVIAKSKEKYHVDDIVVFYYDIHNNGIEEPVMHRIIEINDDIYKLHGDAVDDPTDNQEITKDKIFGEVIYHNKSLGKIFSQDIINSKSIIFGVLSIGLFIFFIIQVVEVVKIAKENNQKDDFKTENNNSKK